MVEDMRHNLETEGYEGRRTVVSEGQLQEQIRQYDDMAPYYKAELVMRSVKHGTGAASDLAKGYRSIAGSPTQPRAGINSGYRNYEHYF